MTDISTILGLAARLPSGLNDPKAADKLLAERQELVEALAAGDKIAAALEGADAVYYAAKHLDWCARQLGLSIETLFALAEAKYGLRAQPGNPKDDAAEREAAMIVLGRVGHCPSCGGLRDIVTAGDERRLICYTCGEFDCVRPGDSV